MRLIEKNAIQFKVGQALLKQISIAAQEMSRTKWVEDAIKNLVDTDTLGRIPLTASDVINSRRTITIRVDNDLEASLNAYTEKHKVTRTTALLDACVAWLAKNQNGGCPQGQPHISSRTQ